MSFLGVCGVFKNFLQQIIGLLIADETITCRYQEQQKSLYLPFLLPLLLKINGVYPANSLVGFPNSYCPSRLSVKQQKWVS